MRKRAMWAVIAAAVQLVSTVDVEAQAAQRSSGQTPPSALLAPLSDSVVLADLDVRNIGPAVMSGRISDIAVAPERPGVRLGRVIYVASAGGGVWKTVNGGKTWAPVFEREGSGSTGAVAVAPSNAEIVWVGSGESNNLRSSSWGDGIYKSIDGGSTWSHMGLRQSQHIGRIIIHPTNPDIVYVAAGGPLWTSGGERGVFKTTDGGRGWRNVKSLGPNTGFTDIAFDPSNPDILYAAAYQRERKAYSFVAGGPESGIWKSTDAGATWTQLTNGLPRGDKGRIGLSVARSQPNTVYAVIHADSGGVFRTDDGGATWRRTSSISSIPWFFGQIRVDPTNVERVYFLGQNLQVSDDGGRQFRTIAGNTHADHHAMWIDPNDSNYLLIGNDGGFFTSYDRGASWDFALNLPVSTFYAIAVDMREPFYWVYGGLQDNGSWGAPAQTRQRSGITNAHWYRAGGGDGFFAAIDPTDPNVVYVESQNGALRRVDALTEEGKAIRPTQPPGEPALRYNWSAPLLISPHDHNTLYFGANYLFRSTNRGDSWDRLGGDLTRQLNRDTLPIMGFRTAGGLGRHDGTAAFGNLSTLDESRVRQGLLWSGSDDGLVHVSRDGGRTWTKFDRFPGVPELTYVSRVIASQHAEGTAYATFDGHRSNDFKPYVLKTTNYGQSWTSIAANLPQNSSVQVIREHHRNPNLLFVGTEHGVWVTANGGQQWAELPGLPTVAVHDLVIHPRENDLVVGTHGRGIWVLDDVGPLERLADAAAAQVAHVFAARPTAIYNLAAGPGVPGSRDYGGDNPPRGAWLTYLVKPGIAQGAQATLAIVDAQNEVVRAMPAVTRPGVHRVTWDLRYGPSVPAPEGGGRGGRGGGGRGGGGGDEEEETGPQSGGAAGPYVRPGDYRVQYRVTQGGAQPTVIHEATVTVRRDPLVRLTEAQYTELYDYRIKAYRTVTEAARIVRELEAGRAQLQRAAGADSASASNPNAALVREIDELLVRLRGPRPAPGQGGGRGGRGGGGAGGAASAGIQQRVQAALAEIATLHFTVTDAQKRAIDTAAGDLERERTRVDAIRARLTAGENGPRQRPEPVRVP
jgi:photosystem II stability/assembly factor-like uncharacterized protein